MWFCNQALVGTVTAIKIFDLKTKLVVDGKVNPALMELMFSPCSFNKINNGWVFAHAHRALFRNNEEPEHRS